jgi:CRP/FNR family transcriptional regulator, nitrogen oxide reductase regulator
MWRPPTATRGDLKLLRQCWLLRGVPARELSSMLRLGRFAPVKRGDVLIRQGHAPTQVYVLLDGTGKLVRNGAKGRQVVLDFLWPGDVFGYAAVLGCTNEPYSASITEDGRVAMWTVKAMARMIRTHPTLADNTLHFTAARLESGWQRIEDFATEPVEQRVARALMRFASGGTRQLPLAQQDVAEFVGTTPPTLSRVLRRWRAKGFVDAGRANIYIRNPAGLAAIAEDP